MKMQIKRFSPHQNAKVMAILMTLAFAFIMAPLTILMSIMMPEHDMAGNPVEVPYGLLGLMGVFYLVFGYLSIALGCWLYNLMTPKIGGLEFEIADGVSHRNEG